MLRLQIGFKILNYKCKLKNRKNTHFLPNFECLKNTSPAVKTHRFTRFSARKKKP